MSTSTTYPAGPSADACCAPSVGVDENLNVARIVKTAKALSDPLRVRVLDVLIRNGDEVCQCELIALFKVTQSLLSHHINKLADAGLITVERRHKWAYYTIADHAAEELTTWLS